VRYRPAEHFVGRERDLLAIHEALHDNPTTVLTQGRVRAIPGRGRLPARIARGWPCPKDRPPGYQTEFAAIYDMLFPEHALDNLEASQKARATLAALNDQAERLLAAPRSAAAHPRKDEGDARFGAGRETACPHHARGLEGGRGRCTVLRPGRFLALRALGRVESARPARDATPRAGRRHAGRVALRRSLPPYRAL
jgi:hypothetical protein